MNGDLPSGSERLLAAASEVIPGGVNSGRRNTASKLCVRSAKGAYFEDIDGRRYTDYHAAYGPIVLGHSHPAVIERVTQAIRETVLFGLGVTEAELQLARKIVHHVPSVEQVLICNSGSEATYHALRAARAATGRQKTIRFASLYHGYHDAVLAGPGGLATAQVETVICRYNDLDSVQEAIARHPEQVAALIVEPVVHNAPGGSILPRPGFLEGLRSLCDREGIALIFDEVITGFRHGLGGYQAICGVRPDLTTMGKAIANGFSLAAVGGRRSLMERFNTHPDGEVFYGGTYNGNAPVVAAALATIDVMEREPVHEHIFALGERMRTGLARIAKQAGVPAHAGGFGSLFVLSFLEGEIRDHEDVARNDTELFLAYRRQMVKRGCFEVPENVGRSHIGYSHTEADIDHSLEMAEQALAAALQERARAS
ncbi:MAG TPA: aspartate aminotransferase family protein [Solirubrobacteraceae bacterium]|jgi:glutamate-1-semialdehyde 2,1-aminomutase|nr:aspartate aminotransferase family protein [Solirubrobacteraceae bacterium]